MTDRPVATAIVNPVTGRRGADDVEAIMRAVLAPRYELTMVRTRRSGDAIDLGRAAARHSDVVVAVGGDGTVSEVATGLLGTEAKLAIIPNGSTNVVARGFNIPTDLRRAAQSLAGNLETRRVDAIQVGKRIALHMVGCGFDALMMEDADPALKRTTAWLAYLPAALRHVSGRSWTFHISVDDQRISMDARMVLVANGAFVIDPRFEVGRGIRPDDGLLDVIVFTPPNLAAATEIASRLAIGRIDRSSYVYQYTGRWVKIESEPSAPVECDGDVIGLTPVELQVMPAAISLLVPATGRTPTSNPNRSIVETVDGQVFSAG